MIFEPTKAQLAGIPKLYQTEGIPVEDKIIRAHFFLRDSHWFIAEHDQEDLMLGFCILNGDLQMAEWGYVSYQELKSINVLDVFQVEYDVLWEPKPAKEVPLIRRARRYA